MPFPASLLQEIRDRIGNGFPGEARALRVSGGSINETYRLDLGSKSLFCKINSARKFPHLFGEEAAGLEALRASGAIAVPVVIDHWSAEDRQVLLLEWISEGGRTKAFWQRFGRELAALHNVKGEAYGWESNNYMGSVPQDNEREGDWCAFFFHRRIEPLLHRCDEAGVLSASLRQGLESMRDRLPEIFGTGTAPSLLHGDLWSGNFLCAADARPVLIDPAVYFGHPSMDLGMTTLFGGFDPAFYEAYAYHAPLPSNHREQWEVGQLYPLLIHLYLFGPGYLGSIEERLKRYGKKTR